MNDDFAADNNSTPNFPANSKPLQIDSEFKNLIPPLSSDEKLQLEANIKEFGCLDPLIVWRIENILLDGHNRYEICTREQIPYKIVEIQIADREAAISWIANHQLGRRNITPEVASYLRGKRYLNLKSDRTNNLQQNSPKCKSCTSGENDNQDSPQSENPITADTAKTLAQQYKVSIRTIKNDARFTAALDTLVRSLGEDIKHSCIVYQINPHSCGIKTWKVDFETVKLENLEKTDGVEEEIP
jgi:hypothetical protein